MENTCNPEKCKLFDLLGGTADQCPNFMENWFKPLEGEPKLVQDCSPRRTLLMVQELFNRQIGLQKAQEEQRNESIKVMTSMKRVIELISIAGIAQKRIEWDKDNVETPVLS